MPSAKDFDVRRPSRFLWAPTGLVDLAETRDLREFQPTFLGTFEFPDSERSSSDPIPDGTGGAFEDFGGLDDVYEDFPISGDSSHDSDLMLG